MFKVLALIGVIGLFSSMSVAENCVGQLSSLQTQVTLGSVSISMKGSLKIINTATGKLIFRFFDSGQGQSLRKRAAFAFNTFVNRGKYSAKRPENKNELINFGMIREALKKWDSEEFRSRYGFPLRAIPTKTHSYLMVYTSSTGEMMEESRDDSNSFVTQFPADQVIVLEKKNFSVVGVFKIESDKKIFSPFLTDALIDALDTYFSDSLSRL